MAVHIGDGQEAIIVERATDTSDSTRACTWEKSRIFAPPVLAWTALIEDATRFVFD